MASSLSEKKKNPDKITQDTFKKIDQVIDQELAERNTHTLSSSLTEQESKVIEQFKEAVSSQTQADHDIQKSVLQTMDTGNLSKKTIDLLSTIAEDHFNDPIIKENLKNNNKNISPADKLRAKSMQDIDLNVNNIIERKRGGINSDKNFALNDQSVQYVTSLKKAISAKTFEEKQQTPELLDLIDIDYQRNIPLYSQVALGRALEGHLNNPIIKQEDRLLEINHLSTPQDKDNPTKKLNKKAQDFVEKAKKVVQSTDKDEINKHMENLTTMSAGNLPSKHTERIKTIVNDHINDHIREAE